MANLTNLNAAQQNVINDIAAKLTELNNAKAPNSVVANKVDKVVGQGLSDTNYTSAEKTKLAGVATGATANATDAQLRDRATHTGEQAIGTVTGLQTALNNVNTSLDTKVDKVVGQGLSDTNYTSAEKTKLAGVATGATANATDVQLRDRATHTGVQAISTVTGLQTALDGKVDKVVGQGLSDTNYTSAEKTKLAGVATGATANSTDAQLRQRHLQTGFMLAENVAMAYVDAVSNPTPTETLVQRLNAITATIDAKANLAAPVFTQRIRLPRVTDPALDVGDRQGVMWYNTTQEAVSAYSSVGTIRLGRQVIVRVRNNTAASIPVGKVVRITGAISADGYNFPTVEIVSNDTVTKTDVIGLMFNTTAAGANGEIIIMGALPMNTIGLSVGSVYLSSNGDLSNSTNIALPSIMVGYCTAVGLNGVIEVAFRDANNYLSANDPNIRSELDTMLYQEFIAL